MKLGILGLGRAGKRHEINARALKHQVRSYDPIYAEGARYRADVIEWADAIIIATPAEYHLQDLKDCIGKPVLCEKPLALTRQYEATRDLFMKHPNAPVYVGFNLRFHPAIGELKRHILEHRDDPPYYIHLMCCQYTDQQAPVTNGVVNDWLCHELDLANWLLGPLQMLDHQVGRFEANLRLMHWPSAAQVHIHSDMLAKQPVRRGVVVAGLWSRQYDLEQHPVTNDDYKHELAEFVMAAAEPGTETLLATAAEGLNILYACERADTSLTVHYDKAAS